MENNVIAFLTNEKNQLLSRIDAIDTLLASYKSNTTPLSVEIPKPNRETTSIVQPPITFLVEQIIPEMGKKFKSWGVLKKIQKVYPNVTDDKQGSICGALASLHKRGVINRVKNGTYTAIIKTEKSA